MLVPGRAAHHSLCLAVGPTCPKPGPGQQREQEVHQQAQQEGSEGQPDPGHPPGHVLRGLAAFLRHQRSSGKSLWGLDVGCPEVFPLEFSWVLMEAPEGLAGPLGPRMQFPREQQQGKDPSKGI